MRTVTVAPGEYKEKNRPLPYTAVPIPLMEPQSWQSVSATRDPKYSDSSGGSGRIRKNGSEVRSKAARLPKGAWTCIHVAVQLTSGTRRLPNASWKKPGGQLVDWALRPLRYNLRENLINPPFLVLGDPDFAWAPLLDGLSKH